MLDHKYSNQLSSEFWLGKKVLITGHTGFKGSWLSLWLNKLGAHVYGLSLMPREQPSLFEELTSRSIWEDSVIHNINNYQICHKIINQINPDIVFHLAAQSLVRYGYNNPVETFTTNVIGTVNVLQSLLSCPHLKVVIAVTTDKVYESSNAFGKLFVESDRLGGRDPYSASKAACEHVIRSYRDSYFNDKNIRLASVRAGNVIGGGDWSLDRLLPDAIRKWSEGDALIIRNVNAVRPWQHVLEPLYGYLKLVEALWQNKKLSDAYNFGPNKDDCVSVGTIINIAQEYFDNAKVEYRSTDEMYESSWLALDNSKMRSELGINPIWDTNQAVYYTIDWYKKYLSKQAAFDLCRLNIEQYDSDRRAYGQSL